MIHFSVEEFARGLTVGGWLHVHGITDEPNRVQAILKLSRWDRRWIMSRSELYRTPKPVPSESDE